MRAARAGHWVVLDELNLAPSEVLEAIELGGQNSASSSSPTKIDRKKGCCQGKTGRGSKFSHQKKHRRFWSMFLSIYHGRSHFGVTLFVTRSHLGLLTPTESHGARGPAPHQKRVLGCHIDLQGSIPVIGVVFGCFGRKVEGDSWCVFFSATRPI